MPSPPTPIDPALRARLDALRTEGWALWERFDLEVRGREFHPFVAANYDLVLEALIAHRAAGQRFLELGSATGVVTIMADLLGFDACGIELDASLVATARTLAAKHGSNARFVAGSFIPTGFDWPPSAGAAWSETADTGRSAYLELGLALDDFDVVFAYPWGGEAAVMRDLMKRYGRADALLLLHDVEAGITASRGRGDRMPVKARPAAPRDT